MLRKILLYTIVLTLTLGAGLARADHDRELRYVLGGALLGVALGELAYRHHDHHMHYVHPYVYYDHAPRIHVRRSYAHHHRHGFRPARKHHRRHHDGHHRSRGRGYH